MVTLLVLAIAAQQEPAPDRDAAPAAIGGRLTGEVDSHDGGVVFLLDAVTGRPLMADTGAPFDLQRDVFADREPLPDEPAARKAEIERRGRRNRLLETSLLAAFRHVELDDEGRFAFEGLPSGRYRCVAQRWVGIDGLPPAAPNRDGPLGEELILLGSGTAEHIAGSETTIVLRPHGEGTLRISTDPESTDGLLLISGGRLRSHPLGGSGAFGPAFYRGLLCTTLRGQRERVVIVRGLPDDRPLELVMFNFDNNGGPGYVRTSDGDLPSEVTMPVFAPWSDGRSDVPGRLRPLVGLLEAVRPPQVEGQPRRDPSPSAGEAVRTISDRLFGKALAETEALPPSERVAAQQAAALAADPTTAFEYAGRTYRLVDWFAAMSFVRLRQAHRNRGRVVEPVPFQDAAADAPIIERPAQQSDEPSQGDDSSD